jgi:hypothetical protein
MANKPFNAVDNRGKLQRNHHANHHATQAAQQPCQQTIPDKNGTNKTPKERAAVDSDGCSQNGYRGAAALGSGEF